MNYQNEFSSLNESDTSSSDSAGILHAEKQPMPTDIDRVVINIHNTEDICIGNIQEEKTLMDYTDEFIAQRMNNLQMQPPNDLLEQRYMRCDSPITVSNYGSRNGSSHNSDLDENEYANDSQNIQGAVSLSDIATIMEDGKVDIKSKATSNKVEKKVHDTNNLLMMRLNNPSINTMISV